MRIAAASRGSSCALGGGRRAAEKGEGLSIPVPPLVNEEAGRPAIPIGEAPDAVRERPASGDPPRDEPARQRRARGGKEEEARGEARRARARAQVPSL